MLKTTTNAGYHIKEHLLGNIRELRRHRRTTGSQNIRKVKSREMSLQQMVYFCPRAIYTLGRGNQDTED